MAKTRLSMKRLLSSVHNPTLVHACELYEFGVHPEELSKAVGQALLVKISRGLYSCKDFPSDLGHQIIVHANTPGHRVPQISTRMASDRSA